ncbi:MAG: alanine racemase [Mariprofundaceae bacterium]|nr:alanine racemase [Mariprofundaceae bacterium]
MSRPAIARIHLGHLRHNFRLLKKRAAKATLMAVVKANAYGHGLGLVAPVLFDEGCRCFAVTDAAEGLQLRRMIGHGNSDEIANKTNIVLLSGIFDAEDAEITRACELTPVISEKYQLHLLATAGFRGKVWLKVNSGMNRLGAENPAALAVDCLHANIEIAGVMSHLACADEPEHPLNAEQARRFREITAVFPENTPKSLLNSAGLIALPDCGFDVVRPGIALYGAEPVRNQPLGLQPVMQLSGQIMQLRQVSRGENISYGGEFTAPRDMRIATVALGYADGLPRSLSNCGHAALAPANADDAAILEIVGRVCMDYCLLDVSRAANRTDIAIGTEIEFWGMHMPAVHVAEQINSIAYELFTGVGDRVRKEAIE